MGTINDKLDKLNQTKTNIKNELRGKGADVKDSDTFASYEGYLHDLEIVNAQTKTVNPSTSSQTVLPDSEYNALSQVTVNPVTSSIDNNIQSYNIKAGVSILGVEGNVEPDKPDQNKTVNPSTSIQEVTADIGYELAKVTINPVTASIDNNITSNNIKSGVSILEVQGKSSVIDTEDSNAVADDIMHSKTAYVNGSKLTGTLDLDTEIANQTALITQLEELVQSKSAIQPVFANGNMSSLNSQVKKFIEPVIEAFTDYLDELQEQNIPYLDEPITIYTPDINTLYFIIVKNSDGTYRILWSKSKYAGFYYVNSTDKRVNFLKTVGVRTVTDEINIHNADWNWSIYGSGADTNWLNKNYAYSSSRFSTLTALINAISNPNAEITYSHPQNSPSYEIDYLDNNYITNMLIWENNNGVQSKILDTIVTTQKLSNNVTILQLNS